MRMRKLGKGQSVVFCGSMEVQRKILECSGRTEGPIEVADVLMWSMAETCAHTSKTIPLWTTQGLRHHHRRSVYSGSPTTVECVERLLEPEAQSLQERYGDGDAHCVDLKLRDNASEILEACEKQVNDIRIKCREFEVVSLGTATCEEEQERELSPENEREQQVELPPPLTPCTHSVHDDVRRLATTGVLSPSSTAFLPAFETLCSTTARAYYESTWPDDLLVTADFAETVQAAATQCLDFFLRPVNWIVSCKRGSVTDCVILSPYEVQELLPSIRQHNHITLHMYSPRLNGSMPTLEDLKFCAIPAVEASWSTPPISNQLNVFAGQLYIRSYEDYLSLCGFLGLCSQRPADDIEVAHDGFMSLASRAKSTLIQTCPFMASPVAFVRMIMILRRKGQSISFSHMGRLLNGEIIVREHFQGTSKE